jgi:hypothetical protein
VRAFGHVAVDLLVDLSRGFVSASPFVHGIRRKVRVRFPLRDRFARKRLEAGGPGAAAGRGAWGCAIIRRMAARSAEARTGARAAASSKTSTSSALKSATSSTRAALCSIATAVPTTIKTARGLVRVVIARGLVLVLVLRCGRFRRFRRGCYVKRIARFVRLALVRRARFRGRAFVRFAGRAKL